MVCIPCIVAPVLLFLWYRFIQPIVLKLWNPWAHRKPVKDSQSQSNIEGEKCPFASKTDVPIPESCGETEKDSSLKKSE